jgi:UDP-2-acetamido-3-amino-2,3-dideoxy-glucuronate N-acetyltransferase
MRRNNVYIHPTANVCDTAIIGEGTTIWQNVQIRSNAIIGEHCQISKDCYICERVSIGKGVRLQNGISVYQGVVLEDDVFVGPHAVFTNDLYPRAFSGQEWTLSPTLVKKGASIGANATIICGNTLGEYCMIGAGSVITSDVGDFTLVLGNPARECGKVNKAGEPVR